MNLTEAKALQLKIWRACAAELNKCSVEPGDAAGEYVVELIETSTHERVRYTSTPPEFEEQDPCED